MDIDYNLMQSAFGIAYPRPYQELIIRYVMDCAEHRRRGRLFAVLPTGSGKSLCFMYPILLLRKRALVIYPLLSLMNDQERRFREAGIEAVILRGGLEREERRRRLECIMQSRTCAVITNPEALEAMDSRSELRLIRDIFMIVIDEAHTAVTWRSFRPSFMNLGKIIRRISPQLVMAFTATADSYIGKGVLDTVFSGEDVYLVHGNTDRENIFYHSLRSLSKIRDIRALLSPARRPALIFVPARSLAERLASALSDEFPAKAYHAGMEKEEKQAIEKWFLASADGVLVSTSAFGMGVDKQSIRSVIHYSLPRDPASFIQEAGRGGRDGRRMDSFVLYYPDEESPMKAVFTEAVCIRSRLLSLMGDESAGSCLGCSRCVPDGIKAQGEETILSFVRRHPLQKKEAIATSMGSGSMLFRKKRLPGWTQEELLRALDILIGEGRIRLILGRLLARSRPGI